MSTKLSADAEIAALREHLARAWALIANVSGGVWSSQSAEWREAAERWERERNPYAIGLGLEAIKIALERIIRGGERAMLLGTEDQIRTALSLCVQIARGALAHVSDDQETSEKQA
jgi:hypothetical protein